MKAGSCGVRRVPKSNLGVEVATHGAELFEFYLIIGVVFGMVVLAMVPVGQITGTYMTGLPSLRAYSVNVAGALTGIVLFALLSSFYVPPFALALLALGVGLTYLGTRPAVTAALGGSVPRDLRGDGARRTIPESSARCGARTTGSRYPVWVC